MAFLQPENYAEPIIDRRIYSDLCRWALEKKSTAGNPKTLPEIHGKPPKGHALMFGHLRCFNLESSTINFEKLGICNGTDSSESPTLDHMRA